MFEFDEPNVRSSICVRYPPSYALYIDQRRYAEAKAMPLGVKILRLIERLVR